MSNILITGASGMIGTRLRELLLKKGHVIKTIGRPTNGKTLHSYSWDPETGTMNENALKGVDTIIHLAGAGVADQRWTETRKREIMDSRIKSAALLYEVLSRSEHQVTTFISASASGYYGDCGAEWLSEDRPAAHNFLADVTRQWELGAEKMEKLGIRHVCCRIGIVLSDRGGALPELTKTLPVGIAGYFAKDPLYYPWVHIDDVCGVMMYAIENTHIRGSYNTTAPEPAQMKDLMRTILKVKHSKAILAPVPPFALKLAMGEMAAMLLSSQRCSSDKIQLAGYKFNFPDLEKALEDVLFHK